MPPEAAVVEQNAPPASVKELSDVLIAQLKKGQNELAEQTKAMLLDEVAKIRAEFEKNFGQYRIAGLEPADAEKFSFAKLIRGMATKNFEDCGYEVELCREAAKTIGKDMSTTVDSAGGFIVPVQVMSAKLIPLLQAKTIAMELGVLDLSGLSGSPVQLPKVTGGTTAQWITENSGATKSDVAFGQVELTPHLVAALTQISLRLANLSSPAAEKIVTGQIAKDLALKIDAAVFNGSGAGGEPTGILQTSGIGTVSSFGNAVDHTAYNKLIDMVQNIMSANALTNSCKWAIDPVTWAKLNKTIDRNETTSSASTGAQPKARRLFDSMPIGDKLLGYSYRTSTQLPSNTILFGDFEQCALGRWGTMILRSSDQAGTSFQNFQIWIQGGVEVDVGVMQPTAFCNALAVA